MCPASGKSCGSATLQKQQYGPRLERTAVRRLASHSMERLDTNPCSDLAHIPRAPRAPARPVSKNAQASCGIARPAARPQVRRYCFEWPANCDGWSKSCPEIQTLIRGSYGCAFDGCAYGLQSRHGAPLKKPWRVQSSCPRHAALLSDRCPGPIAHPLHERTSGREAKRSEKYIPLIVQRLIAGLLAPSIHAEPSSSVRETSLRTTFQTSRPQATGSCLPSRPCIRILVILALGPLREPSGLVAVPMRQSPPLSRTSAPHVPGFASPGRSTRHV